MPGLYKDHSESALVEAFRISARNYLFDARHYDMLDSGEYALEKWEQLCNGVDPRDAMFNNNYLGSLDDEIDPSGFLRALGELVERRERGDIQNPALQKIVANLVLVDEFEVAAVDDNDGDVANILARNVLKTLDQPVPGRLRIFLASYGLAPR